MEEVKSIADVPIYIFVAFASSALMALWGIARNTHKSNEPRIDNSKQGYMPVVTARPEKPTRSNPVKVCKVCNRLLTGSNCPNCGGTDFQAHFS